MCGLTRYGKFGGLQSFGTAFMKRACAPSADARSKRTRDAAEDDEDDDDDGDDEDDGGWEGRENAPDVLPEGQSVLVVAGSKAGERGTVISYDLDDAYDGCYGVDLWSGGRPTFVDRRGLLPRYTATLTGLVSRADLNGTAATVEGWDGERQRYEVDVAHDKGRIKVQPSNLVLPVGARVRIHGLVAAAQHNGRLAKVIEHVPDSGRYDLELATATASASSQQRLRVKRENVRLL